MNTLVKSLFFLCSLCTINCLNSSGQTNALVACAQLQSVSNFSDQCNILDTDPTNTVATCISNSAQGIIVVGINSIKIANPGGGDIVIKAACYSYTVDGSRDYGVSWSRIGDGSGTMTLQTYNLEVNTWYNYVKFSFSGYGSETAKVADIKIYSTGPAVFGYFDGVGIGTGTISDALTINGTANASAFYDYNNRAYYMDLNSTTTSINAAGKIFSNSIATGAISASSLSTTGNVGVGCVSGTTNLKIYGASTPSFELASSVSRLQIGMSTYNGAYGSGAKTGDAVLRTMGGTNSLLLYIPNDNNNGNSYIGFGDDLNAIWLKIGNNKTMRVDGTVIVKKLMVQANVWADNVFQQDYKLKSLAEVERYIKANKHLESVPTEAEVKDKGIDVADMNAALLKKVEELTLYMIELKKENDALKVKVDEISNK